MNIKLFYHSLISDWNHGNAHFLRGVYSELLKKGHWVTVYEPTDGWSLQSLLEIHGEQALTNFRRAFPHLHSEFYDPQDPKLDSLLRNADLVLVHEWTDPTLVKAIGEHRARSEFTLLFHDTHHRAVSAKSQMRQFDLSHYDGALVFGASLQREYQQERWARRTWVWHEAADTDTYRPHPRDHMVGDLVWIGNWGDDERTDELQQFIIRPVQELELKATFYGVRYPPHALEALASAGIEYGGWLPASQVASTFSRYKVTVHVPRRFYRDKLPGIPTIRPFEAMACKIPLLSAPWHDSENLFRVGKDFLMANSGHQMTQLLEALLNSPPFATEMAEMAYNTIRHRHTCRHRVNELLTIFQQLQAERQTIVIRA